MFERESRTNHNPRNCPGEIGEDGSARPSPEAEPVPLIRRARPRSAVSTDQPSNGETVALLVDGPNVFREEFDVDFDDLRAVAEQFGRAAAKRVYFDADAPSGLIKAAEARGFEVIVTSSDVDVRLAVDAVELAVAGGIDVLAVASRDMDFKPLLEAASRHGVRTVVVSPGEHGRSDGLTNAADEVVSLEE